MELESTRIFVKVVQLGSFTKAGIALKLPKSTVSRAVAHLEQASGAKLMVRTTRSLALTAAGRAFYESCTGAIQILEDARKSLQGRDSLVSGLVRITAPEDLGEHVISREITRLAKLHPGLTFELNYTDEVVDLVQDGYDIAIRIGKLPATRLKAVRLGSITLITVASPDYLGKNRPIKKPKDLLEHDCLSYADTKWILKNKKENLSVSVTPKIVTNQMTALVRMASFGAGIACVPRYLCEAELKSGKLVSALPEWTGTVYPVHMVAPLSSQSAVRLKVMMDHLRDRLKEVLE